MNISNLKGGKTILARNNDNFRTPGENRIRDPPNTIKIARSNHWTGGSREGGSGRIKVTNLYPPWSRVRFSPGAWKFPLSRESMVSPPSKLKLFTGNVCVLLTSVALKSSFRSPAEKIKQEWEHSSGAPNDGFLLNALNTLSGYPEYFQLYVFSRFESVGVDPTRTGGPSWSGPTFVPASF